MIKESNEELRLELKRLQDLNKEYDEKESLKKKIAQEKQKIRERNPLFRFLTKSSRE